MLSIQEYNTTHKGRRSTTSCTPTPEKFVFALALLQSYRMSANVISKHVSGWLWAIVVVGILLRIFYTAVTPYTTRGHDAGSHVDYIEYIADHGALPDPHAGLEFYHPPLYYWLGAVIVDVSRVAHLSNNTALIAVQWFGFFLSIVTFGIVLWIGLLLFPRKEDEASLLLFASIAAVLPSFVFFAARINNDVLYEVFAFLGVALTIAFWKRGKITLWYALSVALAIGLLTKGNLFLIVLCAWLCLILHDKFSIRKKLMHLSLSALIIVAIAGWFYIPRFIAEHQSRTAVIGNVNILTNFVQNSPEAYLTFNPIGMIEHPYNDPFDDAARRQYFWEYLARSALYGEFNFGEGDLLLARMMVGSFLLLLVLAAYGIYADRKQWFVHLPVWILLITLLIGHTIFRFVFPYSSSQDFRYSVLLLIPFAFYATKRFPKEQEALHYGRIIVISFFAICSGVFLLSLT